MKKRKVFTPPRQTWASLDKEDRELVKLQAAKMLEANVKEIGFKGRPTGHLKRRWELAVVALKDASEFLRFEQYKYQKLDDLCALVDDLVEEILLAKPTTIKELRDAISDTLLQKIMEGVGFTFITLEEMRERFVPDNYPDWVKLPLSWSTRWKKLTICKAFALYAIGDISFGEASLRRHYYKIGHRYK